ncbi:MAG: ABC transporter ATP-binding protein, partial [Phycisphaeraceae bacterium]
MTRSAKPKAFQLSDDPTQRTQSNWQLIRRMLALSWQYRWGCVKLVGLHLLVVAMKLAGLGFFGLGVDYVANRVAPERYPDPRWPLGLSPDESAWALGVVGFIAVLIFLAALLRGVLTYGTQVATADLVNRQIVVKLRAMVYDKMQRLSFRFFDANESSSLINRVTTDVQRIRMFIEMCVVQTLVVLLSLVVYVSYMVNIHVGLTVACLATLPLLVGGTVWFSRVVRPAYMENRRREDRLITRLSENLMGVHVVKGFTLEPRQMEQFATANEEVRSQKRWIFMRQSLFIPALHFLTHVNILALLGYGGYLAIHHNLPIGSGLMVFFGLLHQFSQQVGNIANIANSMQMSLVGAERVFQLLDTPTEITTPPNPVRLPKARGRVTFDNVSFAYEDDDETQTPEQVLTDIDLTAEPGQCIAILGATGSGKSTLLSLIPRFYDPTRGRVLIDDVDLRKYDLDDLRRNCGLVFQESFLFSNTVAANIAFGHPEATQEQIENAARLAQAHEFIMDLDHGYETVLGERGIGLSGGQRQRLAIARALLLEPPILLLDDPTAAIDPETEGEILAAMDRAMEGRTTFVVAHRLSTLRRADTIIVLEHGRIVQRGTHEQLMSTAGQYQWAANLQVGDEGSRRMLGIETET